jgi:hypothetical protein
VGHHHNGRQRWIAPRPAHEDAVLVDARDLERLERAWIEPLERGNPAVEELAVKFGRIVSRDGGDAKQRAKALYLLVAGMIAARIDGRAGRKSGSQRRRAGNADDEQGKNDYQDKNKDNHGASSDIGAMVALPPFPSPPSSILYRYLRISFSVTCGNIGSTSQKPLENDCQSREFLPCPCRPLLHSLPGIEMSAPLGNIYCALFPGKNRSTGNTFFCPGITRNNGEQDKAHAQEATDWLSVLAYQWRARQG